MAKNRGSDLPVGVESVHPVNVVPPEKPKPEVVVEKKPAYKGIEFLSADKDGQSLYFKVDAAVMEPIDFFVALEEAVVNSAFSLSQLKDISCRCPGKLMPEMLATLAGTGVQVDMVAEKDTKEDVIHILKLR